MLIEQQNAKGGCSGPQAGGRRRRPGIRLAAVRRKGARTDDREEVDVMFGCWTSVSRKSVLPVIEELNGLCSTRSSTRARKAPSNVFYTGAAPNQQAIPAVTTSSRNWASRNSRCWAPTMSIRARPTRSWSSLSASHKGIAAEDIFVNYTPFGHSDWSRSWPTSFARRRRQEGRRDLDHQRRRQRGFYKELAAPGIDADDIPVVAFSVGEEELSGLDTEPLVGHLAAWNYFMSADTPRPTRRVHRRVACLHRRRPRDQRPDGSPLHRLQHVGEGGRGRRHHRCRRRARRDVRPGSFRT
jgi:urea transport system substrate-binding protein